MRASYWNGVVRETRLVADLDRLGPLGEPVLHERGDEDGPAAAVAGGGGGVALGGQREAERAAVALQLHRQRHELVPLPLLQPRVLGSLQKGTEHISIRAAVLRLLNWISLFHAAIWQNCENQKPIFVQVNKYSLALYCRHSWGSSWTMLVDSCLLSFGYSWYILAEKVTCMKVLLKS